MMDCIPTGWQHHRLMAKESHTNAPRSLAVAFFRHTFTGPTRPDGKVVVLSPPGTCGGDLIGLLPGWEPRISYWPRDRAAWRLSLIHISEPTRLRRISYAVFCLKKKKKKK